MISVIRQAGGAGIKKKVLILGSTGNLGQQAIEILEKYKNKFEVVAITGHKNKKLLRAQAEKLKIKNFISTNSSAVLTKLVSTTEADIIINTLSGVVGVKPTKAALKANKTMLLANKEVLVIAGEEIMKIPNARQNIIPLDSEHHAVYEILKTHPNKKIDYIILPCSGGPFLGKTPHELSGVGAAEALKHPRWNMGAKITIESATLINKGMEVIEAHHLFGLPLSKIIVKIHPECKIKGAVKFKNGEFLAYVSEKQDMREHIESAIRQAINPSLKNPVFKDVFENSLPISSLSTASQVIPADETKLLSLPDPDHKTFPGIKLVIKAFQTGQKLPQKDRQKYLKKFLKKEEAAIEKFLKNKLKFNELFQFSGLNL